MEILAIGMGMKYALQHNKKNILIISDSDFSIKVFTIFINSWVKSKKKYTDIKNFELISYVNSLF